MEPMEPMDLPEDYWSVVAKVKHTLGAKYKFSYHTKEDICQEIDLMCLEAIKKWDNSRPLENFLMSHCKKRLINFKRVYQRKLTLCDNCKLNGISCQSCLDKAERAESKKKSYDFVDIDSIDQDSAVLQYLSNSLSSIASITELYEIIDEELPTDLRPYYLKLLHNLPVSMYNKQRVFNSILKILEYYGILTGENE